MFHINDYVVYGEHGVCLIMDIGTPDISGIDQTCQYYVLQPCYSAGKTIYTPVDNEKVVMRRILTEQEATELINKIPVIDTIWITNEKFREDSYKKLLRSHLCEEWVKMIKTLYLRRIQRKAEGKTVTATDEKYLKMAENNLYGELSLALRIPADKLEDYITQKINEIEKTEGMTQIK